MEEREIWQNTANHPQSGEGGMVPVIYLAYWKVQKGVMPGIGKIFGYAYTLHDNTFESNWDIVEEMRETLEIYPKVKGVQIMNDMGNFLFSQYAGKWIPDTPARRRAIISPCVPGTLLATAARRKVLLQRLTCSIRKKKNKSLCIWR